MTEINNKSYTIERYNHTNISRTIADAFGRIEVDAFKNDKMIRAAPIADLQFGTGRMPPLANYEALAHKVKLFGKQARGVSRFMELYIGTEARMELWMLKEKESGQYMAASLWTLPEYHKYKKVPLWQLMWYWAKSQWYKVIDFFSFFPHGNPFWRSGFFEEMDWGTEHTGAAKTPERVAELESMHPKELAETTYPKDLTYLLFLMIVRSDVHGKGYGRAVLEAAMNDMRAIAKPPPTIKGPAKLTLLSAPTAAGFYDKLGYTLGASAPHKLLDGEEITHRYYFMNVD